MSSPLNNSEQKTLSVPLENKTTKIEQLQRSTQNNVNFHQSNGGGLNLSQIQTSSVLTAGGAAQIERRLSWVKNPELLLTATQQELIKDTQIKRMRLIEQVINQLTLVIYLYQIEHIPNLITTIIFHFIILHSYKCPKTLFLCIAVCN